MMKTTKITPNKVVCKGEFEVSKGKRKMIYEDEDSTHDELDEPDEHLAFLSRKFSKFKFKRNTAGPKPFRMTFNK